MLKESATGKKGFANPRYREILLFLLFAVLGTAAAFLSVNIPHTEVFIEGRFAIGFIGFVLLRRWWAALLLACILSAAGFHKTPLWISFVGNMLYTVPCLITIRVVYKKVLSRIGNLWLFALAWFALILVCYQVFNTPFVWAILAVLHREPVWPSVLEGWRIQPFFVESLLVGLLSASGMVAFRSYSKLRRNRAELQEALHTVNESRQRLDHINHVLSAIRNVNQLITHEKNQVKLLDGVCQSLIETHGFQNAWIALFENPISDKDAGNADIKISEPVFHAAFGHEFTSLAKHLKEGLLPPCANRLLERDGLIITEDPATRCHDCPLASSMEGKVSLTVQLKHSGRIYGWLSVAAPSIALEDKEEQYLFAELAEDISYALWSIENETLRQSLQQKYTAVMNTINDAVIATSLDEVINLFNPGAEQLLSAPAANALGCPLSKFWPEDLLDQKTELINRVRQEGSVQGFETELLTSEGKRIPVEITMNLQTGEQGQPMAYNGIVRNITERKKTEAAIQESEARFREIIDQVDIIPVQGYDEYRRVVFWNAASEKVYGYSREEALGKRLEDLILPSQMRDSVIAAVDNWVQNDIAIPAGELVLRDKQGQDVDVYSSHIKHITSSGHWQMYCVDVDLRRLRKTEEALRESEKRYRAIMMQSADCMILHDLEGNILDVNPASCRTYGYSWEQLCDMKVSNLDPDYNNRADDGRFFSELNPGQTMEFEARQKNKQGEIFPVQVRLSLVEFNERTLVLGLCRDITRQKQAEKEKEKLEEQYRQSQKMEAIGQLTGGVAHDFNNLLQVINGTTELAMNDLDPNHSVYKQLRDVANAGARAAQLVSQLLLFSRRQIMRPEALSLNKTVENLLKMLGRVIGEHIRLEWVPGQNIGVIEADRSMIEQVLMNLCVNARDAMPEGGTLTIETRGVTIDQDYCATHAWATPGRYALLSVTDTGSGMDKETLDRIFEPFFTTKATGKGTGLGLATTYGIVKQHEGMINAYSEPGKGTIFRLYWPLSEVQAQEQEESESESPISGGTETILLAEDDNMVRQLGHKILARAGYHVLTAANGKEAIDLLNKHDHSVALVILDVVMPEMGGREAYEQMRSRRPGLKAVFASGYSEDAIHTNFVLDKGLKLIQKPFSPSDLLRAVRSTLDEPFAGSESAQDTK